MKPKRRWQNIWLRQIAAERGLQEGSRIVVAERSMRKDGSYFTRKWRRGRVCTLYPYHFLCEMEDGTRESFRYNEYLGYEARLIRVEAAVVCSIA